MIFPDRSSRLTGAHCAAMLVAPWLMLASQFSLAQQEALDGRQATREYTVKLEASPQKQYCQARAVIEYSQKNDVARVQGRITKDGCMAASGSYILSVRIRDENDEIRTLEFEEQWRSDSELPVVFESEYEIGENVDLVRAMSKRLRCVCAETEDAAVEAHQDQDQE
jgi:hypothetical protein